MATATGWAGLHLKVMALDSSLPGALCTDLSVTEGCRLSLHERCARGTGTAGLVILAVVVAGRHRPQPAQRPVRAAGGDLGWRRVDIGQGADPSDVPAGAAPCSHRLGS